MNRPRRPRPSSTDQVLASIDATVQQRCACGCGAQLDPNGASMWFATQDCQHRWQQGHATNPGEVLRRPDRYPEDDDRPRTASRYVQPPVRSPAEAAAFARRLLDREAARDMAHDPASPGVDLYLLLHVAEMLHAVTGTGSLTRVPPPQPPTRPDPAPVTAIGPSEEGWQPASAGPLPWRRQCGICGHYTEPQQQRYDPGTYVVAITLDDMISFRQRLISATCDACGNCGQPWPGLRMLPQWRYLEQAHRHELRLAAADQWVAFEVTQELVDDADWLQLRAYVWDELERVLVDRLTWHDPCGISGCHHTARAEFVLIAIPGMPHRLKVCPRHEHNLMQSPAYRSQP